MARLKKHTQDDGLLTMQEAMAKLKVKTSHVILRHVKAGRLKAMDIGSGRNRLYRFEEKDIDSFLAERAAIAEDDHKRRTTRRRHDPDVIEFF